MESKETVQRLAAIEALLTEIRDLYVIQLTGKLPAAYLAGPSDGEGLLAAAEKVTKLLDRSVAGS